MCCIQILHSTYSHSCAHNHRCALKSNSRRSASMNRCVTAQDVSETGSRYLATVALWLRAAVACMLKSRRCKLLTNHRTGAENKGISQLIGDQSLNSRGVHKENCLKHTYVMSASSSAPGGGGRTNPTGGGPYAREPARGKIGYLVWIVSTWITKGSPLYNFSTSS